VIFLIEYNRNEGDIVTLQSFDDSQRKQAEKSRIEMELTLNRKGVDHEVVLLEAGNEDALRKTHRRYFEDLHQMLSNKMEIPTFASIPHHGGELSSDPAPTR
jgi:hypothetical protein